MMRYGALDVRRSRSNLRRKAVVRRFLALVARLAPPRPSTTPFPRQLPSSCVPPCPHRAAHHGHGMTAPQRQHALRCLGATRRRARGSLPLPHANGAATAGAEFCGGGDATPHQHRTAAQAFLHGERMRGSRVGGRQALRWAPYGVAAPDCAEGRKRVRALRGGGWLGANGAREWCSGHHTSHITTVPRTTHRAGEMQCLAMFGATLSSLQRGFGSLWGVVDGWWRMGGG
ncbi:hypothetical protein EDC01DRAFT_295911 [Geopyxis carbonaria]|nr:hypothetical protein EDC01DRAFT_295911 [Geopyxis carbonaria]